MRDLSELKEWPIDGLYWLLQTFIVEANDEWRKRLWTCVFLQIGVFDYFRSRRQRLVVDY